ncbi:MAG: AmmeMemoRadiSam system protein B [Planctomycetes bacterium]|nr:AmmeMemoRadiSam system protein B [Planctomycetota bacterium]
MARFAGSWYEGRGDRLTAQVEGFCGGARPGEGEQVLGLVAPHAGYRWSGAVAGSAYGRVRVPDRVIVLCPNHTGAGARFSLWPGGPWETPLGPVEVDEALTRSLGAEFPEAQEDEEAHRDEHSGELQLPFIRHRNPAARVAMVCVGARDRRALDRLGEALARVVEASAGEVLLVASSDMNHHEPHELTMAKDERALDRLRALDAEGLYRRVQEEDISMCGILPTYGMVGAACRLGAREAEVVDHRTSGDFGGPRDRVVGYAAVVVR